MDRTKGVGGTDIAAIIGLNPWKSAVDVYMEKLGLTEPQEDNESMWWGREMEPVLQKRYEQETGLKVTPYVPIVHEYLDWYVGTPDGLIFTDDYEQKFLGGVDYKTTGYSKQGDWGEAGTDEVPPYYHTQAMWYMGLTGAKWWDIAVLFMGARREFRIYRINRDDDLIGTLIEKGKDFWENHVIPQIPPPVDASPGWDSFFKAKYPREEEDIIEVQPDTPEELWALLVRKYKEQAKEIDDKWAEAEHNLKMIIGDHAGVTGDFGKIIWKKSKDRTITDWEKAFREIAYIHFASDDKVNELITKFTTTKPGPRVFKTYFKEQENE